jgi:hypothetical protein
MDAIESTIKNRDAIYISGKPARSRIPTKVEKSATLGRPTTKGITVRSGTTASAGNSERVRESGSAGTPVKVGTPSKANRDNFTKWMRSVRLVRICPTG